MEDQIFKKRTGIMIHPDIKRTRQDTFFYCSDCYKSITKQGCVVIFYCNKCKLKLCVNCFDDSGKCVNCLGELCRFEKCVSVDVPDTMDDFVEIKSEKKRWWCVNFNR